MNWFKKRELRKLFSRSVKSFVDPNDAIEPLNMTGTFEEKKKFAEQSMRLAARQLMWTFYSCEFKDKMDGMFINDTNGDEFVLIFKKVTETNREEIAKIAFSK